MQHRLNRISLIILFPLGLIIGCTGPERVVQYKQQAEEAASAGRYEESVEAWKSFFENQTETGEKIDGALYARAAKTAWKTGNEELTVSWFDQARYRDYADPEMYIILAEIFREKDNLSKELSALEYYREHFSKEKSEVNSRLFTLYYEIDQFDKALTVWEPLPEEVKRTENKLEKFFAIQKEKGNEQMSDSVSQVLLEVNPEHTEALEWNALKFYWQAENRYQREMEKYNQNKTTSQYRKLLDQLDVVTADFKKSLRYFKELWEQNPGEKYAPYMANIYTRFNDEEKAEYYKQFLN